MNTRQQMERYGAPLPFASEVAEAEERELASASSFSFASQVEDLAAPLETKNPDESASVEELAPVFELAKADPEESYQAPSYEPSFELNQTPLEPEPVELAQTETWNYEPVQMGLASQAIKPTEPTQQWSQQSSEMTPTSASSTSLYERSKEELLSLHAQFARNEKPAPFQPVSIAVDEQPAQSVVESNEEEDEKTEDEPKSLLHYLLGFLPGASTPHSWRPVGTAVFLGLILFFSWHVINGKDGLSVWQQKRAEDHKLQQEIQQLQAENERVRDHIDLLNKDKDAIEREARERLHYAKPGEIIYTLPEGQTEKH